MQRFIRLLLVISLLQTATNRLLAQEDIDQEIAELQKLVDEATIRKTAGEPAINAARATSNERTAAVVALKLELSKSDMLLKETEGKLPKLQEAVKRTSDQRASTEAEATAAAKAASEARGKENEQEQSDKAKVAAEKLVAATKELRSALDAIQPIEDSLAATRRQIAELPPKIKAAEQSLAAFQPELQAAESAFAALSKDLVSCQIELEKCQVAAGRLVSFAAQVAPIFSQRCLACHNARTAKGRLNLESFANLTKGGESGASIVASKPADSLLLTMVEDHSMPKDADPLMPEQIATIKKWIETGARLDAGVAPTAALITIMPKLTQPMPPETYRVTVPVMALNFSPDGSLLATSGYREVLLWNPADGQLVRRVKNLAERPHDIEFSSDGSLLAVAAGTPGQLGEVKLFNVADGSLVADLLTTDDEVFSVAFSPDGTRLGAACADRTVRLFDVASHQQQKLIEDHADWVMDVAWSPDGKKIATASRDKTSKVFESTTGESLATFNVHAQPIFGVGFLPDGNVVATCGRDNRIRIWTIADSKQVREIAFGGEVFRISIQPDATVFSGCSDKFARQHNLGNGAQIKQLGPHNEWVYAASFHAPSKRIATGSHDGEVRIWNYEDGKELIKFLAAPGLAQPVAVK